MVGLLLHPGDTSETLLQEDHPPYVVLMFLFTIATICLPIFFEMSRGTIPTYHIQRVFSLLSMYTILMLIFVVFETVFLFFLGVRGALTRMTAAVVYSLVPLVVVVWIFYILSYLSTGGLEFVTALLEGRFEPSDTRMKAIPYAIALAQLAVFIVFVHAVRAIGDLYYVNALILTLVSIIPLQLAVLATKSLMDTVRPGLSVIAPDMLGLKMLLEFVASLFNRPSGSIFGS